MLELRAAAAEAAGASHALDSRDGLGRLRVDDGRERARGDRVPGQAASQLPHVHAHGLYDFECDTSTSSPYECALAIKHFLERAPARRAFDVLRTS